MHLPLISVFQYCLKRLFRSKRPFLQTGCWVHLEWLGCVDIDSYVSKTKMFFNSARSFWKFNLLKTKGVEQVSRATPTFGKDDPFSVDKLLFRLHPEAPALGQRPGYWAVPKAPRVMENTKALETTIKPSKALENIIESIKNTRKHQKKPVYQCFLGLKPNKQFVFVV